MKILATSDLHGEINAYKNLSHYGKNNDVDILVIAGDLTSYSNNNNQENIIKEILNTINKPVLFIMGNDDEYEWTSEKSTTNINMIEYKFEGISFVGYQFTNPFVGGLFEKPEEEQAKDFKELSKVVDNNTILVTHGPCYGILDKVHYGLDVGSKALNDFCKSKSPKYHLFGHIHESFGCFENHYNISFPEKKNFVLINTDEDSYEII